MCPYISYEIYLSYVCTTRKIPQGMFIKISLPLGEMKKKIDITSSNRMTELRSLNNYYNKVGNYLNSIFTLTTDI